VTNLEALPDDFIGRQAEQTLLVEMIDAGRRIITIHGPGGCGKTRFVKEFGYRNASRFDAVFFCDLADARSEDDLVVAMGRALNVPLTQQDAVKQLGFVMAGLGRAVLILDNFEQLAEDANPVLNQWLTLAPQAAFVVTSRHRLSLLHERVLNLEPLALPTHNTFDIIAQSDAVQLFVTRAKKHHPTFVFNPHNAPDIAALVAALDGLPLAIELAAARSRLLSPARMLAKLTRRFELLKSRQRHLTARQTTLRGALAWSWDLLTPWEQVALAQSSVFEGGFTQALFEFQMGKGRR